MSLTDILDATFHCVVPVEANQYAPDNMKTEQESLYIPPPQTARMDGQNLDKNATPKYRHYIRGKIEPPLVISCLKIVAIRPSTSFYTRRSSISASRYSQARHLWTCKFKGEYFTFGKGIAIHVEAGGCCRNVSMPIIINNGSKCVDTNRFQTRRCRRP